MEVCRRQLGKNRDCFTMKILFGLAFVLAVTEANDYSRGDCCPYRYYVKDFTSRINENKRKCLEQSYGVGSQIPDIKERLFIEILLQMSYSETYPKRISDFKQEALNLIANKQTDKICEAVAKQGLCTSSKCPEFQGSNDPEISRKISEWLFEQEFKNGTTLADDIFEFLDPAARRGVLLVERPTRDPEYFKSTVKWTQRGLDALQRTYEKTSEDWILSKYEIILGLP